MERICYVSDKSIQCGDGNIAPIKEATTEEEVPLLLNNEQENVEMTSSSDQFQTAEEDLNPESSGYMSDDERQNNKKQYMLSANQELFRYLPLQENQ